MFKRALKKFGQSSEVWTAFAEYYFNRAEPESARELLPRSLKSLPKDERTCCYLLDQFWHWSSL